jgi:hypothetical protein
LSTVLCSEPLSSVFIVKTFFQPKGDKTLRQNTSFTLLTKLSKEKQNAETDFLGPAL